MNSDVKIERLTERYCIGDGYREVLYFPERTLSDIKWLVTRVRELENEKWRCNFMGPFEYKRPDELETAEIKRLTKAFTAVYELIQELEPSAERTLAVRKLQESRMWINVAILGIKA